MFSFFLVGKYELTDHFIFEHLLTLSIHATLRWSYNIMHTQITQLFDIYYIFISWHFNY